MNTVEISTSIDTEKIKRSVNSINTSIENQGRELSFDNFESNCFHVEKNRLSADYASKISEELNTKATERFIFDQIQKGNIEEIKNILSEISETSSSLIAKWKNAFCREPIKRSGKASLEHGEIRRDSELIKNRLKIYSSKWIALYNNRVVGINKNLESLKRDIHDKADIDSVTFLRL